MSDASISTQVDNVLAGRTALGAQRLAPIPFPRAPLAKELLVYWARVHHAAPHMPGDEEKTAFIRKLAHYLIRNWPVPPHDLVLIRGTTWFISNPSAIRSKINFKTAANLLGRHLNSTILRRGAVDAVLQNMPTPEPACPVIMAFRDYTLVELIHPQHLIRAGLSANNCLVRRQGNTVRANHRYWADVKNGHLHIYALARGTVLYAVISAEEGYWDEFEIVDDRLSTGVADKCLAAIERRIGPLSDLHISIIHHGKRLSAPAFTLDPQP